MLHRAVALYIRSIIETRIAGQGVSGNLYLPSHGFAMSAH